VWISVFVSAVLLATFLNCHIYYNISKTLHFPSLLLYFSIFVEESFSIPSIIEKNKVYRMVTIFWLLTAVVLTNLYNSHVISELNSPLKGAQLTSMADLYGSSNNDTLKKIAFSYYLGRGPITQTFSFDSNERLGFVRSILRRQSSYSGFTFLSDAIKQPYPEDVWTHISNPFLYTIPYENLMQIMNCDFGSIAPDSSFCQTLAKLMHRSNKYYPSGHTYKRPWKPSDYPRGAVEEKLTQCQKSVFLEPSNQLEFKYMSENYRKNSFYYLQDGFESKQFVWPFFNLQKSRLPFYFSLVLQSGVWHDLHKLKLLREHQRRRNVTLEIIKRTEKPEVLDLHSSVQTIFILIAAIALVAKTVFVAEVCFSAWKKRLNKIIHFKTGRIVFKLLQNFVTKLRLDYKNYKDSEKKSLGKTRVSQVK